MSNFGSINRRHLLLPIKLGPLKKSAVGLKKCTSTSSFPFTFYYMDCFSLDTALARGAMQLSWICILREFFLRYRSFLYADCAFMFLSSLREDIPHDLEANIQHGVAF